MSVLHTGTGSAPAEVGAAAAGLQRAARSWGLEMADAQTQMHFETLACTRAQNYPCSHLVRGQAVLRYDGHITR